MILVAEPVLMAVRRPLTFQDIGSIRAALAAASTNPVIVLTRLSLLNLTGGWWRMTKAEAGVQALHFDASLIRPW